MTDTLDNWQPEVRVEEADAVLQFVTRYFEIHRKPPSLRECSDGTRLNEYRVKRAIARLRRQNLLSQTSLRPMNNGVKARFAKKESTNGNL